MSRKTGLDLILVVEDGLDLYDLVTTVLELDPYVTTAKAEGGEHALSLARTLRPDLIILDVRQPGQSGLRAARRLKADPTTQAIPRVAIALEPRPKGILRVCDYCVTKPYDLARLTGQLRQPPAVAA